MIRLAYLPPLSVGARIGKLLNTKHRSLHNTFAHFNSFPLLLPVRLLPITSKLSNGRSGRAKRAATHKVEEKREVLGRPSPPLAKHTLL